VHTFHHPAVKKAFFEKIIFIFVGQKEKLFDWLKNLKKQSK
tara:strand:+ start:460 stop:582 length:123 start_codon:yes stop_codon:yes gene_type:complete